MLFSFKNGALPLEYHHIRWLRSLDLQLATTLSCGGAPPGTGTEENELMNWPNSLAPAENKEGPCLKPSGPALLHHVCQREGLKGCRCYLPLHCGHTPRPDAPLKGADQLRDYLPCSKKKKKNLEHYQCMIELKWDQTWCALH